MAIFFRPFKGPLQTSRMPSYPSCKDAGADGNQAVDEEARGPHMEHETQITGIPPHWNLNLEKSGETLEKNLGEKW